MRVTGIVCLKDLSNITYTCYWYCVLERYVQHNLYVLLVLCAGKTCPT